VLWPRGDRADDLARKLRASALVVVDPVAYATRARRGLALPECEAVFFASPSAVQAWEELTGTTRAPRSAIAIGATTFDALVAGPGSRFEALTQLAEANPEALRHALAHMAG
jgi:uroporphyrinogen-III synthase